MAEFNEAVNRVLEIEGGLNEDPDDRGGITNYGISFNLLKRLNKSAKRDDIINMTKDEAKEIYRKCFWEKMQGDRVNDQELSFKILGILANIGEFLGIRVIQRAYNAVSPHKISVDGIIGNETINAINAINTDNLIESIRVQQRIHYLNLIELDPRQIKFKKGWLRRADM